MVDRRRESKRKETERKLQSDSNANYLVFSDKNKTHLITSKYGSTVDAFQSVQASIGLTDVVTNVNVRRGYSREDYENFRSNEALPTKFEDIINAIRGIYYKNGIVRSTIDLLTDFACDDMKFIHPDLKQQAFYEAWRKKTNLNAAVNQFTQLCIREENVVVKRVTARITKPVKKQIEDKYAQGKPDIKIKKEPTKIEKNEIPWSYKFLDVTKLQWVHDGGSSLTDFNQLIMPIPRSIKQMVNFPKNEEEKKVAENLPNDIKNAINEGKSHLVLDQDKLYIAHCKKNDWELWSIPSLYAIINDVQFRDKLRQAEISALDGVINVIRLWKLGDHKEGMLPNSEAVSRLANILESNTGGGAMDIIWDSLIEMEDYYPPIDKILGPEKYEQVNRDILIGLGIPEVLIGGHGANFSNSFIQLKTVIEKLEYIREKIVEWLTEELSLINEAMGFKTLPLIKFNNMNLRDENVERALITGLLDRGVVSPEAVLEVYGRDFNVEVERMQQQKQLFEEKGLELKGPFSNDDQDGEDGDKGGRPLKDQDKTKRKDREAEPREAELSLTSSDIIESFDKYVVPLYLRTHEIDNARKLTKVQKKEIENLRVGILSCLDRNIDINEEIIYNCINNIDTSMNNELYSYISKYVKKNKYNTIKERKNLESIAWTNYHLEKDNV